MSLSTLAAEAVQSEIAAQDRKIEAEIRRAANNARIEKKVMSYLEDHREEDTPESRAIGKKGSNVLDQLVKFIPVEVITLYVAAVSATESIKLALPGYTARTTYFICIGITPVILLLVWLKERRANDLTLSSGLRKLPLWQMIAATIAFAAWALAIPDGTSTATDSAALGAGYGLLALLASTVLNLIDGAVSPKKG